jgi:filamentous hemagglutinin family protein
MNIKSSAGNVKCMSTSVRLSVAAVAACFVSIPALSNPVNPTVVNGTASFNQVGKVLTVTNSNGAIINWDKFSIKTGETTHFAQASASSSVLNRVLNDPTAIYGTLSSNGRVWLVNPSGIMVGPGGRVDTAGFVASTLSVSNENFLAGRNLFANGGTAQNVINQGEIRTPAGGSVYLIGSNVGNEGIITTAKGETILAAGQTVSLIDSATPGVKVNITGAAGNATNLGTITSEAGRIGIAGVIVRNSGVLNASSVASDGGRIYLKASSDALVEGGRIEAKSATGKGGRVDVLGDRVAVLGDTAIDASGATGGGSIRVGGDYQGANPEVANARVAYLGANTVLKADATETGAGGTAIVWADDTTRAFGTISARGAGGGAGGFVETSGKNYLDVGGIRVDTGGGSWLLDPTDITVVHSGGSGGSTFAGGIFVNGGGTTATINDFDINANLASNDITITTSSAGGGAGDIKFDASAGAGGAIVIANGSGPRNLTLTADHDIIFTGGSTTFASTAPGSPLDVGFNAGVGRKVEVQAGATAIFNGGFGSLVSASIRGASGKSWENFGTVTLSGTSYIDLNVGGITSTFNNKAGATLNLASTQGWAIQSEAANQAEAINNAGTINVTASTAIEAAYSQTATGVLNIAGATALSLQHLNSVAGAVNLNGGGLQLLESHAGLNGFYSATISGPGTVQIGKGASGAMTTVLFDNVTTGGGLKILREQFGGLAFSGANTFADTSFFANDAAGSNIHWIVPAATYSGTTQWWAKGNIGFAGNIAFSGPVTLGAGWNVNLATPAVNPANPGDITISGQQITGTAMNLFASNNIGLTATTASALVGSSGAMVVDAGGTLSLFGSNSGGFNATLDSGTGSQTIHAGSINMAAGSGGNWAYAQIKASGDQQITTTNGGISLGGGSGVNYGGFAQIWHGAGSGNQSIAISSSGLNLAGGMATGTTTAFPVLLPAVCQTDPSCLSQPVTGAWAGITNSVGSQTIDFQSPASTLNISGGSGGIRNAAWISQNGGGVQTISGAPIVTMNGGGTGGSNYLSTDGFHYLRNNASIFAPGAAQVFAFDSLTMSSTGGDPNRVGTAWISGHGQTISVAGPLSLLAGSTNAGGGSVGIQSTAGQTITAGAVSLAGGGSGYDNSASIRQLGSGASQSLTANSLTIQGGSGNGTGGSTGDCGAPCNGSAASNNAGIYNAGSGGQTIDVTAGTINILGGTAGNRNNAYIQNRSASLQTVDAVSIYMQGGDSGGMYSFGLESVFGSSWLANNASISSGWSGGVVGSQSITVTGNITVKGNSGAGAAGSMGGAAIAATGAQTISGAAISVSGGSGGSSSGAGIISLGNQSIAASSLLLQAGATGTNNRARVTGYGQSISLAGGILSVIGGGTSASDYSNEAEIVNFGGAGQTITFSAAANMTVQGGQGSGFNAMGWSDCGAPCNNLSSSNSAQVRNEVGFQTIDFQAGGNLSILAGSNGNDNRAYLRNRSSGLQQILGDPAIILARGASGGASVWAPSLIEHPGTNVWHEMGNDAGIEADAGQTIQASSISMNAAAGSGFGGLFITGHTQNITVSGAVTMSGAPAGDAVGSPIATAYGNATEFQFKAPVVIGNDSAGHSLMLDVGSLAITGGGYGLYGGSPVLIGTYKHATNTTINSSGGIMLNAAPGAGSVQIGSFYGNGGSLTMIAGGVGMSLDRAYVGTGNAGSVVLATSNGPWSQTAGGRIAGNSVAIVTGSGDVTQPVGAVIDAFMLNAAGNNLSFLGDNLATSVTLTSTGAGGGIGYNTAADAHIVLATATTGDITLTTTSAPPAFLGLGTITASAGNVTVTAEHAILDDNGAALNITGQNIWLTSNGGGSVGGLAISMDTQASGWIKGKVNGGVGGIAIRNQGDFGPAFNASNFFELDDSLAASGNQVGFHTSGNLDMGGASFKMLTANAGDIGVSAGGDITYNGGAVFQTSAGAPFGRVVIQAGNDLQINGTLGAVNGSFNLSAGNLLAINQAVAASDDIMMMAPTIDIAHAVSASATGQIAVIAENVNLSGNGSISAGEIDIAASNLTAAGPGAEIWASAGDIRGIFLGDVRLNDGAHLKAPLGDVKLAFLGADSMLYLNDVPGYAFSSYIMASPNTVNLTFTNRNSGGIIIDGTASTTTVAGGSGFYSGGPPGVGTPLVEGAGLLVAYPSVAGDKLIAVIANAIEKAAKDVDPGSTPTDADQPLAPAGDTRPEPQQGDSASNGNFGGEESDGKGKDKDEKDEKGKQKPDGGKDGKKDEKSGQKKVSQCT